MTIQISYSDEVVEAEDRSYLVPGSFPAEQLQHQHSYETRSPDFQLTRLPEHSIFWDSTPESSFEGEFEEPKESMRDRGNSFPKSLMKSSRESRFEPSLPAFFDAGLSSSPPTYLVRSKSVPWTSRTKGAHQSRPDTSSGSITTNTGISTSHNSYSQQHLHHRTSSDTSCYNNSPTSAEAQSQGNYHLESASSASPVKVNPDNQSDRRPLSWSPLRALDTLYTLFEEKSISTYVNQRSQSADLISELPPPSSTSTSRTTHSVSLHSHHSYSMFSGWTGVGGHGKAATESSIDPNGSEMVSHRTEGSDATVGGGGAGPNQTDRGELQRRLASSASHRRANSSTDMGNQNTNMIRSARAYAEANQHASGDTGYSSHVGQLTTDHASGYTHDSLGRNSVVSDGSGYASGHGRAGNWSEGGEISMESRQRRRKKKLAPPETLVIVRPPPSKQNHPLNLQIQLVIPQMRNNSSAAGRVSLDSPTRSNTGLSSSTSGSSAGVTKLDRRGSMSSQRSGRSEASSGGASIMSSSSGARRVTPLYNLSFHNIFPTTVNDAGTDQKVAKYGRNGVEIDGLGVLEPRELIYGVNDMSSIEKAVASGAPHGLDENGGVITSGAASLRSDQSPPSVRSDGILASANPATQDPPTSFQAMTPAAKGGENSLGGKFMNKLKRFSLQARPGSSGGFANGGDSTATSQTAVPPPGGVAAFKRLTKMSIDNGRPDLSSLGAAGSSQSILSGPTSGTLQHNQPVGSIASRGEAPQMIAGAAILEGHHRTEGYVWTVRRLSRKVDLEQQRRNPPPVDQDGDNLVLNNVWRRFHLVNRMNAANAANGDETAQLADFIRPPQPRDVPIRFEWTRDARTAAGSRSRVGHRRTRTEGVESSSKSLSRDRRRSTAGSESGSSPVAKRRGPGLSANAGQNGPTSMTNGTHLQPPSHSRPSSILSSNPGDTTGGSAASSAAGSAHEDESGNEAEGGDGGTRDTSISRDGADVGQREDFDSDSDPEDSETSWSCHLVMSSSVKIPIGTLSPAPHHPKLVAQLAVPFPLPDLSASGIGQDEAGLTREELKDIISVTCLHLVIRESFGGLGRKRKGDAGWKLDLGNKVGNAKR